MHRLRSLVAMVLAGGAGQRLRPLTLARCKPAVPFGGTLRLIDFTLINCLESGVRRVFVLAQRQQATLREHVAQRWSELARAGGAEVVFTCGQDGYTGNADAVLQNLPALEALRPDAVLVLSADHVYRADYARLVELHLARGADATILTGTAAASEASRFGVLSSSPAGWITSFVEKPLAPEALVAGRICDINLGVYCFRLPFLRQLLLAAAARGAARDFGKDILPAALAAGRVLACPLSLASPDDCPYWRDVGTVASYFEASMDLVKDPPAFGLEHPRWPPSSPWRRWLPSLVRSTARKEDGPVEGWNLIAAGARIETPDLVNSIVAPGVRVGRGARIERCILFPGAKVEGGVRLRNVIVEEGTRVTRALEPAGRGPEGGRDAESSVLAPVVLGA
jgi:glucose-1-phosphate adenylyltransferase